MMKLYPEGEAALAALCDQASTPPWPARGMGAVLVPSQEIVGDDECYTR